MPPWKNTWPTWKRANRPDREAFLARHAGIAAALVPCLDGLDVLGSLQPGPPAGHEDMATANALGDFRILREIGRGGMGVVYEAEQVSLGRRVALKVLPFAATMDPRQLRRFQNEARAAAHLHHTNIVPVFAVGCERSVHFYAMQFIEGQSLANVIASLHRRSGLRPSGNGEPAEIPTPHVPSRTVGAPTARTPSPASRRRIRPRTLPTSAPSPHSACRRRKRWTTPTSLAWSTAT